ncbi:MAG: hypothetical protein OEW75_00440 [Cyclobacteriaceae bacterium]|nr:hypothetical protein [Cyclobacteriaceae bacterium]
MAVLYLRYIGILITLTFTCSLVYIVISNPKILEELNEISLTQLNLNGIQDKNFISLIFYKLIGTFVSIYAILIYLNVNKFLIPKLGAILLFASGIMWLLLGVKSWNPEDVWRSKHLFLMVACWVLGNFGIIFTNLFTGNFINQKRKYLLLIPYPIIFVLEHIVTIGYSGIVSAITWFTFFLWFTLFSILVVQVPNTPINNL